ncbi:MAG: hypothetical protein H6673_00170 [Anaerolineales bacterium]|nr:hypothetical protein [Anaerolineales bacterium]
MNTYDLTSTRRIQAAQRALSPVHFGFKPREGIPHAWTKRFSEIGMVGFAMLSWHHANQQVPWGGASRHVLETITEIQKQVWGIQDFYAQAPLELAIIQDTGGYIGVAYELDKGFTEDGWLGFVLGYGSPRGVLVSHKLGIRPDQRSTGIGRHLKLLQAYEAVMAGHHTMEWTFDPMRSHNAHFNFNKLGGTVERFTVSKYGPFRSELYGDVPSDRFVVTWRLTDPQVLAFLQRPIPPTLDLGAIPDVKAEELSQVNDTPYLKFTIPRDIDEFTAKEPEKAVQWRQDLHFIGTHFLDSKRPKQLEGHPHDPALLTVEYSQGTHRVTHFVDGCYVFTRKDKR